jgi:hypothetical protein
MVLLLDPYVDAVLLLALAFLIVGIMRSIAPFLAKIPWVGGSIANAAEGIARAIAHACGVAFGGIDHAIGVSFHAIAGFLGRSWHELRSHAYAILQTATILGLVVSGLHLLRALIHALSHSDTHHTARIKRLEREYKGIEHQIKQLEKEYHGIDELGLRKKLGKLAKEVDTVRDQTIPALRDRVASDEGTFAGLEKWLGIKTGISYKEWAVALAATLLASIGLGGLRCNSLSNNLDKRGCSMWGALDDLLGLVALGIAAGEFETLIQEAQGLTHVATSVFDDVFGLTR